jgi:serine O-acetyltransferase
MTHQAKSMSPEWLWLLSIRLHKRGLRRPARWVRNLNSFLYHNSLPVGAEVSPDVFLGHHGLGVVVHSKTTIGARVWIWHNVTIIVRTRAKSPHRVVIEDDVRIGAGSVIIAPYESSLIIGAGARIGAGALVTKDVAPGVVVVSEPSRVRAARWDQPHVYPPIQ